MKNHKNLLLIQVLKDISSSTNDFPSKHSCCAFWRVQWQCQCWREGPMAIFMPVVSVCPQTAAGQGIRLSPSVLPLFPSARISWATSPLCLQSLSGMAHHRFTSRSASVTIKTIASAMKWLFVVIIEDSRFCFYCHSGCHNIWVERQKAEMVAICKA